MWHMRVFGPEVNFLSLEGPSLSMLLLRGLSEFSATADLAHSGGWEVIVFAGNDSVNCQFLRTGVVWDKTAKN